jgi:hypothetical protein
MPGSRPLWKHLLDCIQGPHLPQSGPPGLAGRPAGAVSKHDARQRVSPCSGQRSRPACRSAAARGGCLSCPVQGHLPRPHRLRSALLSRLVRRARPGPLPGPAPAPGAIHPVDAGSPPVQAFDGLPAVLGHRGVLPDLRHRRPPGALTSPLRPPSGGAGRVADTRIHPPAVRGVTHRRPPVCQPE